MYSLHTHETNWNKLHVELTVTFQLLINNQYYNNYTTPAVEIKEELCQQWI